MQVLLPLWQFSVVFPKCHVTFLFHLNSCVPDNHRSYSLGLQFIFQRSLGFLPGPVLFGWMFDSVCLFWGESCGKRGRCQIYDVWKLSEKITIFGCSVKGDFFSVNITESCAKVMQGRSLMVSGLQTKFSRGNFQILSNVPL